LALKDFAIIQEEPPLEHAVVVEFWDGPDRRTAHVLRRALEDKFDDRKGYRKPDVSMRTWSRLVEENLPAFERIAEAKHRRVVSSGQVVTHVEVDYADIRDSGEKFTCNALLDDGIASPRTGTQRQSLP